MAVAAARLGLSSAFIGKVGEDPFGRRLAAVLEESGVDTRGMRYDPLARTTLNFITLPDPHSAEYLFYRHPPLRQCGGSPRQPRWSGFLSGAAAKKLDKSTPYDRVKQIFYYKEEET